MLDNPATAALADAYTDWFQAAVQLAAGHRAPDAEYLRMLAAIRAAEAGLSPLERDAAYLTAKAEWEREVRRDAVLGTPLGRKKAESAPKSRAPSPEPAQDALL